MIPVQDVLIRLDLGLFKEATNIRWEKQQLDKQRLCSVPGLSCDYSVKGTVHLNMYIQSLAPQFHADGKFVLN